MNPEEKLISKKDLLSRYGISYGSLYRWKRKGLIPDEWFIRKATVTGQETFFPEALTGNQQRIAGKYGRRLVGAFTVSGWSDGKYLPDSHS